jgi:nucleotide-binding universal stress UspA family protein
MNVFSGKMLLATDGSAEATRAARMAVVLANRLGSKLHVVHVGPMPEEYINPRLSIPEPEYWEMMRERAEEEAKPRLNEQVQKIREASGEVSGAHVRVGLPDVEIVGLAEELGAGLVVLGSRGLGPLKRALMGSVSDSVVRHAHGSVLVVRGNGRERDYLPGRILLALDGSREAAAASRTAVEITNATGSELHVVHARIPPDYPIFDHGGYDEGVDVGAYVQEKSEELARRGQGLLDEQVRKIKAAGGSVAQAHLRVGRPDVQISALAEEIGAGLIVVGSRGLGAMRRVLMGSVSSSVVRHAHCPVLVVRGEEQ